MKTKLFLRIVVLALLAASVSQAYPVAAQSVTGTGTVTCNGDGLLVFQGFARRFDASGLGSIVISKDNGIVWKAGHWREYQAGRTTILVGQGVVHGRLLSEAHLIFSGANGHVELAGRGKIFARGDGYCVTEGGSRVPWPADREAAVLTLQEE